MTSLAGYLFPYIISQVMSLFILIVAWKSTRLARWLFFLLFLWASGTNMCLGLTNPDIYLEYADMAIPLYRDFITGWFSTRNHILVPMIAFTQFFIAIAMLLKNTWVRLACIGSIIFLMSIAPLGVGSGFPFSITVSIAAIIIYKRDNKYYAWKRQVKPPVA